MHLAELEALAPIVNVDGLALAIYKSASDSYGWVLAAGCNVVAFDGWYPGSGDEHLEPLLGVLQDPDRDGIEEARIMNNRQIGSGLGLSGSPLSESGLDSMPHRADDDDSRGWGSAGLRANRPFQEAQIVAVAALGSADTLRWLAARI
jgi:hypothetical protein